jgi:hypothetical protein
MRAGNASIAVSSEGMRRKPRNAKKAKMAEKTRDHIILNKISIGRVRAI